MPQEASGLKEVKPQNPLAHTLGVCQSLYIPSFPITSFHLVCILFILVVVIGRLWYHVCMNEKNEKLYTIRQLAEILQLSQNHLYIMCRRGEIPYIDVGVGKNREYRFVLDDVKNKLKERDRK